MGRWWVFYEDWQMECCGTPFSAGEEVTWPLVLDYAEDLLGGGWSEQLGRISAPAEWVRDGDGGGVIQTVRADDGLVAALHGDPVDESGPAPDRWVRRVGLLTVERHRGRWPETTGRVLAIALVHQGFVETGPDSREYFPDPRDRFLEPVTSCPSRFGGEYDDIRTETGARRHRRHAGVLVELHLPDPRT
ncbi:MULTISPECIES: DUF6578 domain-containing protein [unclassified Streptomyces]|uniref:DUF6578 domain-containing protein n=1 Tax=unclassified Streptomyces TaxID=2593676 RepID=UPI002E815682|nr:DUF6578 domain-containing protein [Streptomyces sp. NBC_00589]WTI39717.1 hypothetical protein OIC96_34475 [Streptomyces sp. NBC_00775]WUB26604.1 hypothetical protein OHA51_15255 [Streptomyces sp. NBC_00589]